MEILNQTPLMFANLPGRLNFPGHSLALIVKGTFDLKEGQMVEIADEQLYPGADEFYPGDDEMQGAPRYEMDFACLKPKADLLLVGKCHAPGKDPVKACRVTFRVGSKSRSLAIFGKRSWKHDVMGLGAVSEPRPFRTMELRYEKSYGGVEYKKNPVGKGYARSLDTVGIKGRYLPNIEDPDNLIESSGSHPEPAGFGPLNRMWALRHSKIGTYKGKYQKERWPWFAEDFDYSHFNAAPPEMQLEGYLHGDEELFFENLHKKHSHYTSRLPGLKVRAFVNKLMDPKSDETAFAEVPLNLDTLWVDMEAEKLVLVWRGWTEVLSEEYEEIQHIYIKSEKLDEQPKTLKECQALFLAALAEELEEPDLITEEPDATRLPGEIPALPEDDRTILAVPVLGDAVETKPDISELAEEEETELEIDLPQEEAEDKAALLKNIEAQTAVIMAQFGLNIESLPAEMSQKMKEEQQRILNKMTGEDPQKFMEMEQEERENQMRDALSELGLDADNLPPLSDKAKSEQGRLLHELGLTDQSVLDDIDLAKYWQMLGAVLPKAGIDPENLDPMIEKAKPLMDQIKEQMGLSGEEDSGADSDEKVAELQDLEKDAAEETAGTEDDLEVHSGEDTAEIPELEGEEGPDVKPSREQIEQKIAGAESLADMDLGGVNLSGLQMPGADFSGTILAGAVLSGVNLAGAKLSGATLNGADLSKSNLEKSDLSEADVSEGNLSGANLSGAQLSDTVFEKAKMENANMDEAEAKDTIFTEADLSGSSFKNAQLSGADLSNCMLEGADFQAANLTEANLEGAKGQKINFQEADLTKVRASEKCDFSEGIFVKAKGLESIWQEANLNGADFSFSHMEGADFSKASLQRAILSAANMKFSRFVKADMKEAKMLLMNLFEGSLEKADLSGADLSGSNLYAVEFLESILENTILNRANLKKTKLEKK